MELNAVIGGKEPGVVYASDVSTIIEQENCVPTGREKG